MRTRMAYRAEGLAGRLIRLSRAKKRALMLSADLIVIPAALWAAIVLKHGTLPSGFAATPWPYLIAVVVSIPIFVRLGLYRAVIRYIGPKVMVAVLSGVTASALILASLDLLLGHRALPITAVPIYWALALVYVGGSRILARSLMNTRHAGADRAVIYGAVATGAQVAIALRAGAHFDPVAFVDDDPSLQGSIVSGIEVLPPSQIKRLINQESVQVVLLALPSQSRRRRREILKRLEPFSVRVMKVPDLEDLLAGAARVDDIRDVDAHDVLGRDPVPPDAKLLDACIRGKSVMVTGAGGSIGSELCRQIIRLGPRRLILFEMSEIALYTIHQELNELAGREGWIVELVALLGNTHHRSRIREVMQAYGVQTVYHAAAYKHVPIVEENQVEGVHNNVFSTLRAAEAALDTGVETFVLISTDKAVNPTNVMGATKRFAEIVLQGLQQQTDRTRFCMVRFGNVLGSSGSVVPLFEQQIRAGGPLTVTHPDVQRYFMTIPEAAQLVLQAGSMGTGGDVFVLDMGKPVKVDMLARHMIALMGFTVRDKANADGDIEIVYSGLRPGEKLYEELLIGKNVTGTGHPKIMRAIERALAWDEVQMLLREMMDAQDHFDCKRVISVLERAVSEYQKAPNIHDLVWCQHIRKQARAESGNVAVLAEHRAQKMPPATG